MRAARTVVVLTCAALTGCLPTVDEPRCGPSHGVVAHVIDGDTLELESGERVRLLLVDTPESTTHVECFGAEAAAFHRAQVQGRTVQLSYDAECTDRFGRLLAFVQVGGQSVNQALVAQGYACVLHIPPNGESVVDLYRELETRAIDERRGLWSACVDAPC